MAGLSAEQTQLVNTERTLRQLVARGTVAP